MIQQVPGMNDLKRNAFCFFKSLEDKLNASLPEPALLKSLLAEVAAEKTSPSQIRENVFLYHVLPFVFEHMQTVEGIGPDEAQRSILCEYFAKVRRYASGNAFRRLGYPFNKKLKKTVEEVIRAWQQPVGSFPPNQAFPDLTFRSPFPYKTVFDAKYFAGEGRVAANRTLVEGVYEAAFYRGLPRVLPTMEGEPEWNYEFGCLLAYDASAGAYLQAAWNSVKAKAMFWDGGNLFVMIIRGQKAMI